MLSGLVFPLAISATLLVAGCAPTPLMQATSDTMRIALVTPKAPVFSRRQVEALPYYQLQLDSANGSALLLLGRQEDGREFWAASTGQVLVIKHGLVRRMTGFATTLEGTQFKGTDPFENGLHRLPADASAERIIDWMPGYRYGISLHSRFRPLGVENIKILDEDHELLDVVEELNAPTVGWAATNRYWVDPRDGTILKSEQQLTPDLRVTLTALRPWRGGEMP